MSSIVKQLRTQIHEPCITRSGDYHLSEQEIAGLWFTETVHPPFFQIPMHSHEAPSFYVVLQGGLTEVSSQHSRHLLPYGVVFNPPGEIHSNKFDDKGGRCLLVEFMPRWNERLASARIYLDRSTVSDNAALGFLATRLYREFRFPDAISPLAIESLTMEILVEFCRQRSPKFRPTWLQKARELLHDQFSQAVTLDQIADAVGVHPVHLSRAFRERYYCSFSDYQRGLRIEYSCKLLRATKRSLVDVALSSGFSDQAHFSRVFKKFTGMTPAEFRQLFG